MILPIFAVGGFFTGMDTFVGMDKLGNMAHTVDSGFMFTVGGLMMLAAIFTSYPLTSQKQLAKASNAQLAVWFTIIGGLAATISALIGDFTQYGVSNSGVEDAVASTGGFYLVSAALFYPITIGVILAALSMIHTGRPNNASLTEAVTSTDIHSYTLVEGSTTIRTLLGRGVGIDTKLNIGEVEEDEGGSSLIRVSAQLHNDEIVEYPDARNWLCLLNTSSNQSRPFSNSSARLIWMVPEKLTVMNLERPSPMRTLLTFLHGKWGVWFQR